MLVYIEKKKENIGEEFIIYLIKTNWYFPINFMLF